MWAVHGAVAAAVNVLALDLATKTGWALLEAGREESGVETFDVKPHESRGMRFVKFNRWLDDFALAIGDEVRARVDLIVYEQPIAHAGGNRPATIEIAMGFVTRVQEFCARYGIEHSAVYHSTLKKYATGRGNAKKPEMLEAVARRWRRVDDDNEADAIALLHYALDEIVPAGIPRA